MTLPKGYKAPDYGGDDSNSSNNSPSPRRPSKARIALPIIGLVGVLIWFAYTQAHVAAVNSEVDKAKANLVNTANRVIADCLHTLPRGTYDCDTAIPMLVDGCQENNYEFSYCTDGRIKQYLDTRLRVG